MGDRNTKCQWRNTRSAKCALRVAQESEQSVQVTLAMLLEAAPADVRAECAAAQRALGIDRAYKRERRD